MSYFEVKRHATLPIMQGFGRNMRGATIAITQQRVVAPGDTVDVDDLPGYIMDSYEADDEHTKSVLELVSGDAEEGVSDAFDPSEHNVGEVLNHLQGVDADEVARVQKVEEEGKKRSTILSFEPASAEDVED